MRLLNLDKEATKKKTMTRTYRYFLFIIFCTLSLFSCRTDPAKSKTTTSVAATEAVITSRLRADPTSLNPMMTYQGIDLLVLNNMFQTMIEYDPYDLKLKPVLAKALPTVSYIEENGKVVGTKYSYEIKSDAKWENGQPVLASDYVFTLKLVMNPKMGGPTALYRSIFKLISNVTIDPEDPKKFSVTIAPYNFRGQYYGGGFQILPEYIYDSKGLLRDIEINDLLDPTKAETLANSVTVLQTFADEVSGPEYSREKISGSGPYALKEWITNERIILEKKKNWWGDKYSTKNGMFEAYPRQIIYRTIPDATPATAMLQNGTLDAVDKLPNTTFLALKDDPNITKNYHLLNPENLLVSYVGMNNNNPKLKDKKVRQALAHLMDMDEVINSVKLGMASKLSSVIPSDLPYAANNLKPYIFDIKKASQLLTEAGWKDSNNNGTVDKVIDGKLTEMKLEYIISAGSEVSSDIAVIFKNAAKKAGVDINVLPGERGENTKKIRGKTFELAPAAFGADLSYYDLFDYWHTTGPRNYFGFGNAATDKIIEEIRSTTDDNRRNQLYQEIQEIMYEESPIIFLYRTQDCVAIHKRFDNAKTSITSPVYTERRFRLNE